MNRSRASQTITVEDNSKFTFEVHSGAGRNCHNGTVFDFSLKKGVTVAKKIQVKRLTLISKDHPDVKSFLPPWSDEYGTKFVSAVVPPLFADLMCLTNGNLYLPQVITWTQDQRPIIELQIGKTRCNIETHNGKQEYPMPELQTTTDFLDVK